MKRMFLPAGSLIVGILLAAMPAISAENLAGTDKAKRWFDVPHGARDAWTRSGGVSRQDVWRRC